MSTILDALKKSEQERKLNKVPTLSDMPAPQERSKWPFLLALVGVLSLFLVLFLTIRQFNADPETSKQIKAITNETLNLSASGAPTLQTNDQIVVNVVSYSEEAEQRFVMINGKLFRENDFIEPGLKVESINPSSVLLNQRGKRFTREP